MSEDVSFQYYCFLVHERNEINRLRRRLCAKKNNVKSFMWNDDKSLKYAGLGTWNTLNKKYKECQATIREYRNQLTKIAKALGAKNDWRGATGTINGIWKDEHYYDKAFIMQQHKEYIIEQTLLQQDIVNPYKEIRL